MQGKQKEEFQAVVDQWKETARKYGKGVEEETMEFGVEYPTRVTMHKYTLGRLFVIPDTPQYMFANPAATVGVRILKTKAHINRLIRSLEEQGPDVTDVWVFLQGALDQLAREHPAVEYDITLEGMSAGRHESYATNIQQTQEFAIACGVSRVAPRVADTFYLMFRTPVHTVCPFILHETAEDGHVGPSHTQRAYVQVEMWATHPPKMSPIIREINTRLQPCQSAMKIPDEAVQVLRAYSTPTYTEDAVFRVLKIIRGIKDELVPSGHTMKTKVFIQSLESIFQNDMTSEAEDEIE